MCIDISEILVNEMCAQFDLDNCFFDFLLHHQLIVNKYNRGNSQLGKKLEEIAQSIYSQQELELNLPLFGKLSHLLIEDRIKIYQNYGRLNLKSSL